MATYAEQGRDAYRAGRFTEAARLLEQAVAQAPQDTALRLMLARCFEQSGRHEQARSEFRWVASHADRLDHQKLAEQALSTLEPHASELEAHLVRAGKLTSEALAQARLRREPAETTLGALLRLTHVTFSDLVEARFAPHVLPPPFERAFRHRLGSLLVERHLITQFQLKQALMAQALSKQPLGQVLIETQGVKPEEIQAAVRQLRPVDPKLLEVDKLGPLLVRWGLITPEQWNGVLLARQDPGETLLARHLCTSDHLRRVVAFQHQKLKLLNERRYRLGEVLVDRRVLSRDQLGKMLACQVDQPFPLGELLLMQRLCTPEALLEALAEQQRRYTEAAEASLPPLTPMPDPAPAPDERLGPAHPLQRRRMALALGLTVILAYSAWYGLRYSAGHYDWLKAFVRTPAVQAFKRHAPNGDVRGVGHQLDALAPPSSAFDSLGVPNPHTPLGSLQAHVTARSDEASEPFARTQAPSIPDASVVGLDSPSSLGSSSGAAFDGKGPEGEGVAYPMQAQAAAGDAAYPMEDGKAEPMQDSRPGAFHDETRPDRLAATGHRTGVASPYAMGRAESQHALTSPAQVPPAPVYQPSSHAVLKPGDLSTRTVRRSSSLFRYRLGQAYFSQGLWASAQEEFVSAIRTDPSNPLPLYFLGRLYEQRGDRTTARSYFNQYLQRTPNGEFSGDATVRLHHPGI